MSVCVVFYVKQNTAYVMRISDWSSDVCSSDRRRCALQRAGRVAARRLDRQAANDRLRLGDEAGHRRQFGDAEADEDRQRRGVGGERSAARRVGQECVSTCRSRGSPSHLQKKPYTRQLQLNTPHSKQMQQQLKIIRDPL